MKKSALVTTLIAIGICSHISTASALEMSSDAKIISETHNCGGFKDCGITSMETW